MPSSVVRQPSTDFLALLSQNLDYIARDDDDSASEDENQNFLDQFLNDEQLKSVFDLHDLLAEEPAHVPGDDFRNGRSILGDARNSLSRVKNRYPEAKELHRILAKPHVQHLLEAYDDICNCRFDPELGDPPEYEEPVAMRGEPRERMESSTSHRSSLADLPRQIGIRKEANESLGITVVRQDTICQGKIRSRIVVERIISGSVIDRQGLLNVGDVILEVNEQPIETPEALQRLLKQVSSGMITMKILPGPGKRTSLTDLRDKSFVRAFFSYNPRMDSLIPYGGIGISFEPGDILEVASKDDPNFWQARRMDSAISKTGLIPSDTLEERRKAFARPSRDNSKQNASGSKPSKDKKKKKHMFSALDAQATIERSDIWTYEEVKPLPACRMPCLLLIGPYGVGRRSLKKALCQRDPSRFAYPIPDSSQPRETMEEEMRYLSRGQMDADIRGGHYIEWNEVNGHLMGVRFAAVREIIAHGLTAVVDCLPKSVHVMRRPEFNPHVVFIAAPSAEVLSAMQNKAIRAGIIQKKRTDAELEVIVGTSAKFERRYRHLFDSVILNDNFSISTDRLVGLVLRLERQPGWIPAAWELDGVPVRPPVEVTPDTVSQASSTLPRQPKYVKVWQRNKQTSSLTPSDLPDGGSEDSDRAHPVRAVRDAPRKKPAVAQDSSPSQSSGSESEQSESDDEPVTPKPTYVQSPGPRKTQAQPDVETNYVHKPDTPPQTHDVAARGPEKAHDKKPIYSRKPVTSPQRNIRAPGPQKAKAEPDADEAYYANEPATSPQTYVQAPEPRKAQIQPDDYEADYANQPVTSPQTYVQAPGPRKPYARPDLKKPTYAPKPVTSPQAYVQAPGRQKAQAQPDDYEADYANQPITSPQTYVQSPGRQKVQAQPYDYEADYANQSVTSPQTHVQAPGPRKAYARPDVKKPIYAPKPVTPPQTYVQSQAPRKPQTQPDDDEANYANQLRGFAAQRYMGQTPTKMAASPQRMPPRIAPQPAQPPAKRVSPPDASGGLRRFNGNENLTSATPKATTEDSGTSDTSEDSSDSDDDDDDDDDHVALREQAV